MLKKNRHLNYHQFIGQFISMKTISNNWSIGLWKNHLCYKTTQKKHQLYQATNMTNQLIQLLSYQTWFTLSDMKWKKSQENGKATAVGIIAFMAVINHRQYYCHHRHQEQNNRFYVSNKRQKSYFSLFLYVCN